MGLRPPPQSPESEQALLGAVMLNNDALSRVEFLKPEHFFDPLHARIFSSMQKQIGDGRRAWPGSLKPEFPEDHEYLGQLAAAGTTLGLAADMGKAVHDLAVRRQLIEAGERLIAEAFDMGSDNSADTIIEGLEESLSSLAERGTSSARQFDLSDALNDAIEVVAAAYQRDTGLVGLSTGFVDLDVKLGGLANSELIILAGRPSMGKSALAANIALSTARAGHPVGFFTVEMSAQAIALRLLGEASEVSSHRMRQGRISENEFNLVIDAAQRIAGAKIQFDETGAISIAQLCARARRWKRKHHIELLVVDYLQLMSGVKRKEGGRVQEVTEITTGLKALAKELEIPVLALSQLSRKVEERDDKRPQLADLRESGSIEQDADVVMFIYREEYYLARTEPKPDTTAHLHWQDKLNACTGRAEIIISKQRHGPTGTVALQYTAHLTRFSNLDQRLPMEAA